MFVEECIAYSQQKKCFKKTRGLFTRWAKVAHPQIADVCRGKESLCGGEDVHAWATAVVMSADVGCRYFTGRVSRTTGMLNASGVKKSPPI